MTTADFIKRFCVGMTCPDFDYSDGCHAYDGEECDEAFNHPRWRGLKMADRVTKWCERAKKGSAKEFEEKKLKEKVEKNKEK